MPPGPLIGQTVVYGEGTTNPLVYTEARFPLHKRPAPGTLAGMSLLNLKTDLGDIPAGLEQMLADDLPFTIALFLTYQAQSGAAATKAAIPGIFTVRNTWTQQNIKITPAKKGTLFSEVYTDTENRQTGAPDYLPRQDEGGEKMPVAGHRFLAIPTKYLRKLAPGAIPDQLRPKNLLPPGANLGEEFTGSFARAKGAPKVRRAIGREARKKLGSGEFVAFVQQTKSGTLCIFVRHGGMGYHGGSADAEPWYTLIREAHIKPRFPMEQIVQAAVDQNMDANFDRAAAQVLVNNALKSGLRVKF